MCKVYVQLTRRSLVPIGYVLGEHHCQRNVCDYGAIPNAHTYYIGQQYICTASFRSRPELFLRPDVVAPTCQCRSDSTHPDYTVCVHGTEPAEHMEIAFEWHIDIPSVHVFTSVHYPSIPTPEYLHKYCPSLPLVYAYAL